ncbi:PASTA domain-containing protein [Arundinibacter roseus]|uniref:PASTA domain-containing protein n=1 Tax=Arundinibacter roseus TaxID=2070510 RepID=A0A4R4KBQ8_9BACT|nr:PASTA domain-containing protein [Arundinibacter roseus]TDB65228.1 PASTA domain-containing protein [Arundinibacter roseus]
MAKISTNSRKDLYIHIGIIISLITVLFLAFFFLYLPIRTNHGESITVPDIRNMSALELEDFLDERDLRFEVDCTFVPNVAPLTVVAQYPQPGSKVKEGRKIYVTVVARTAPMVKMPKLTDMTQRSAQMILKSEGLEVGNLRYVPDLAQGAVLKQLYKGQEILPGQPIAKGSKIDLEIGDGLGATAFDMPSVVGMILDEAKFQIVGAGLKVGQIMYVEQEGVEPGMIVRQNPEPGNKTRIGDVIDLWVVGPLEESPSETDEQPQ